MNFHVPKGTLPSTLLYARILFRYAQRFGWRCRSFTLSKTSESVYLKLAHQDGRKVCLRISDHHATRWSGQRSKSRRLSVLRHRPGSVWAAIEILTPKRLRARTAPVAAVASDMWGSRRGIG